MANQSDRPASGRSGPGKRYADKKGPYGNARGDRGGAGNFRGEDNRSGSAGSRGKGGGSKFQGDGKKVFNRSERFTRDNEGGGRSADDRPKRFGGESKGPFKSGPKFKSKFGSSNERMGTGAGYQGRARKDNEQSRPPRTGEERRPASGEGWRERKDAEGNARPGRDFNRDKGFSKDRSSSGDQSKEKGFGSRPDRGRYTDSGPDKRRAYDSGPGRERGFGGSPGRNRDSDREPGRNRSFGHDAGRGRPADRDLGKEKESGAGRADDGEREIRPAAPLRRKSDGDVPRESRFGSDRREGRREDKRDDRRGDRRNDGGKGEAPTYNLERYAGREKDRKRPKDREYVDPKDGKMRLNRYIANAGICSRREADELIAAGEIKVNGEVVTEMGHMVGPEDTVQYGKKKLNREKMVYVLLNKPKDFITTTEDPEGRKTVMDLVAKASKERIFPVGRLDRNTTGLLLFTNDGELAQKLSHPSHKNAKIYQVELDKPLTEEDFNKVLEGVELEDGKAEVDELAFVSPDKRIIGIEVHIGKNRIVRRIFEHLGYDVVALDRVQYAGLTKKDLPRGKWRFLTEKEVVRLKYFM